MLKLYLKRKMGKNNIMELIISIIYYGYENIIFNNVTAEYEEEFNTFNYKSYKIAISNEIN